MFRSWTGAEPQHLVKVGFRTCFYYILVVLGSNSCCSIKYSQFFLPVINILLFLQDYVTPFFEKMFSVQQWTWFDVLWTGIDLALVLLWFSLILSWLCLNFVLCGLILEARASLNQACQSLSHSVVCTLAVLLVRLIMARFNKVTFKVFLVKRCLGWSGLFVGVDWMVIG